MDISVIVNCHKENLISYVSLRSAKSACDFAASKGLSTEVIVVLDSPDKETSHLIKSFQNSSNLKIDSIFTVEFRSLGAARNFGVSKARGEYIAFLDGDDLWSENWLAIAHEILKTNSKVILHPAINVYFGERNLWWEHIPQDSKNFDIESLIYHNYWTALIFCSKEILSQIPYHSFQLHTGFSFEDWHWHCETIRNGYIHKIAHESAHFIRTKESGSLNQDSARNHALIPETKLFRIIAQSMPQKELPKKPSKSRAFVGRYFHKLIMVWAQAFYFSFLKPFTFLAAKLNSRITRKSSSGKNMPIWLQHQLKTAAEIEPQLFPSPIFIDRTRYFDHSPKLKNRSDLYFAILRKLIQRTESIKAVCILPSINSEQFTISKDLLQNLKLNLINDVLFLTTNEETPALISDKLFTIAFGEMASHFNSVASDLEFVLARLLIEIKAETILSFSSPLAMQLISHFGKQLKTDSKLLLFLSDEDLDQKTQINQVSVYINRIYALLEKIYVESTSSCEKLIKVYGLNQEHIETVSND